MHRREFIAFLGGLAAAAPRNAAAQTQAKVYRLALISPQGVMPESHPNAKFLLGALAELAMRLGKTWRSSGRLPRPGRPSRPRK